jgi:catechol-2,3-dioxygenase
MQSARRPNLRLGEIVLRTSRYEEMRRWYRLLLELEPYFETNLADQTEQERERTGRWANQQRLCFFRLMLEHPYQQVLALFDVPGTGLDDPVGPGLHHLQLRDETLQTMAARHCYLKSAGIVPFRTLDHGPSLSSYYRDPDHNVVEISASNHVGKDDFLAALGSREFRRNPSGRQVDADAVLAQLCEPEAET